jgi:hypothetical protein
MAILDQSLNPVDMSMCISESISSFITHHPSVFPFITMPIDLSNLSAEDITAATTAMEAARRAHEEREHREAEEQRKQQEEEWKEAAVRKEVERKEAAA